MTYGRVKVIPAAAVNQVEMSAGEQISRRGFAPLALYLLSPFCGLGNIASGLLIVDGPSSGISLGCS